MKKKLIISLFIALILLTVTGLFMLKSYSDKKSKEKDIPKEEIKEEDPTTTVASIDLGGLIGAWKNDEKMITIVFENNMTGYIKENNKDNDNFKFTIENDNITIKYINKKDEVNMTYKIDGDKLILTEKEKDPIIYIKTDNK